VDIKGNGENVFHLPRDISIKIKKGNYEVEAPGLYFQLLSNGTAYLREKDGKTTYFETDEKITTILKDGTQIKKKMSKKTYFFDFLSFFFKLKMDSRRLIITER